jgi:hypothetical protein
MAKAEAAEAAQSRGATTKAGGKDKLQTFQYAYDEEEPEEDE